MWPCVTISPDIWEQGTWASTLLGTFYHKGSLIRDLWSFPVNRRLEVLSEIDHYCNLKKDVLTKIARADRSVVKRLFYTYRAIEDSFLVSTPSIRGREIPKILWDLWKWVLSYGIHNWRPLVSDWKSVILHIRHLVSMSPTKGQNRVPSTVPGRVGDNLGPLWFDALPWLSKISIHGLASKDDAYCATQFCFYRNLPTPSITDDRKVEEAKKLDEQYNRPFQLPIQLKELARSCALEVGNAVSNQEPLDSPHISLTASASLGATREEGGRAIEACKVFVDKYVKQSAGQTFVSKTWFGAPYSLEEGTPPFYTMCRMTPLTTEVKEFLNSSFQAEFMPGKALYEAICGEEDSMQKLHEPIFGIDECLPYQILQLAIEQAIEEGFLDIEPYFSLSSFLKGFGDKPIEGKMHFISEPCDKVRALTIFPWWLNIIVQPFAHWLAGRLGRHPILNSSFTRTYKCWDFANILSVQNPNDLFDKLGMGALDLTGATNGLRQEFTSECLKGFMEAFQLTREEEIFFSLCTNLLYRDRRVRLSVRSGENFHLWKDGHPMSDAGAKEILSLQNAVVHLMAVKLNSLNYIPLTLSAGDDVIVECSYKFFLGLIKTHNAVGNVVQGSKVIWTQNGIVFFCEEGLYLGCPRRHGKALYQVKYEDRCHIDTIKLRLLTPYGVQSLNQNPEVKNPAIGKGAALARALDWSPYPVNSREARIRFFRGCANFLRSDPLGFLPRSVGGLGLPLPPNWSYSSLAEIVLGEVDSRFYFLVNSLKQGGYHPVLDRLTSVMSSGGITRGLVDPFLFEIVGQYAAIAEKNFKSQCMSWNDLKNDLIQKGFEPEKIRNSDILKHAKRKNLKGWMQIAHDLDRVTLLRIAFTVADGQIDIEETICDPSAHRRWPSQVLNEFVERELPNHAGTQDLFRECTTDMVIFTRDWIKNGFKPEIRGQMGSLFIPSAAIHDPTNGMRVAIPYRVPDLISGDINDPFLEISEGYDAKILYLKRLYSK